MKLLSLLILTFTIACSSNNKTSKETQINVSQISYTQPLQTVIKSLTDTLKPKVNLLKNSPKPTQTKVPNIGEKWEPKTHKLLTSFLINDITKIINYPEIQGVGLFTTYTSIDGLAMDAISFGQGSLTLDHNGNIWIATQGGGVSKYDGKTFSTYSTNQGLANNTVNSIIEDKNGNMWFGTDGGGVSKFDGETFITYNTNQGLVNNTVNSIIEDNGGNIWFGTLDGVSKYNGDTFINYSTDQGLANNSVYSLLEDKNGNIWFGTNGGGVSKYDGKTFITYNTKQGLANNTVFNILEDKNGYIWFGTYGGGISKYNGEFFTNYNSKQGLANNYVSSAIEDKNGNIWFGTDGGVSKYNGETFCNYSTYQGLANNTVNGILEDKSGNIWFGTVGGLCKYEGKAFTSYNTDQGLVNNYVNCILQDKKGNIWFGTDGGGVSKYNGKTFTNYNTHQGLTNNTINSILEDKKGDFWFGTDNGVSKFKPNTQGTGGLFTTYTTNQGLADNTIFSIIEDSNGNIWFGTGGGISKYNDGINNLCIKNRCNHNLKTKEEFEEHIRNSLSSFTNYSTDQGLANNTVRTVKEDKNGNIWFGTDDGISKYNGESTNLCRNKKCNHDLKVQEDLKKHNKKSIETFTTYRTQQGLASNTVVSISEDKKGNVWFGTYGGGINILPITNIENLPINSDITHTQNMMFLTLNKNNGLPDNNISAIRFNSKGDALIGTNFGLYVISNKEVNRITVLSSPIGTIKGKTFNQFNGYPVKDVNTGQNNGTMLIDNQDVLWIGHGSNGVTRVDLNALSKNTEPIEIEIKNVQLKNEIICYYSLNSKTDSLTLNQQEVTTYKKTLSLEERDSLQEYYKNITFDSITKWHPLPENLVLPYKHNALTFEYNAIETDRNYLVNYQYMLSGSDTEWSNITKKKEATHTNLTEGNYTFLLKAQSPYGVWSNPIAFNFTISPPWYRTWWAYLSYALMATLGIWLLIKIQTKKLKKRQIELEKEVKIATKKITKTLQIVEQQKEQVEEVHKEITDSINYAERIQRSFLASNDTLNENLGDYFILFKPKGVVSGDFYWAENLSNGSFAIVNADSTGHSVPGAIMSILNINSIEKAIYKGLLMPADIFNDARKTIIERLKKDGSEDGGKDGMDASIICFDFKNLKMTYCAAQNPIWIIRNGEVILIKPEKMPVGKHDNDHIPFVGGEFVLQKGDQVYTLTDGFQDQFGGPKGKKFMVKRLRHLVLENSALTMKQQHQKLEQTLNTWMKELEQVDDICIIGICI